MTFWFAFFLDKDLCICMSRERTKTRSIVSSILAYSSSNVITNARSLWLMSKHRWLFRNIRGCAEDKGDHLRGRVEGLRSIRRTTGACNPSAHALPSASSPRHHHTRATDAQHQLSARTPACSSSFRGRRHMTTLWKFSVKLCQLRIDYTFFTVKYFCCASLELITKHAK